MHKLEVQSHVKVGSLVKFNKEYGSGVDKFEPGEYVIHLIIVAYTEVDKVKSEDIEYFFESLSNDFRDYVLTGDVFAKLVESGDVTVSDEEVEEYEVEFKDLHLNDTGTDRVFVKKCTELSNEYFNKRVEAPRHNIGEHCYDLERDDIEVTSYKLRIK